MGKKYIYRYEACVASGFPQVEQQYAGLKIMCDAVFYIQPANKVILKVRGETGRACARDGICIWKCLTKFREAAREIPFFLFE